MSKLLIKQLEDRYLDNIVILNLINSGRKFRYNTYRNSTVFYFERFPEEFNVHFSCYTPEDIPVLLSQLEFGKYEISCLPEWIYPYIKEKFIIHYYERCYKFYLPENIHIPDVEICIQPIKNQDIKIVNDRWPFKSSESFVYLKKQIEKETSAAIYKDGKIAAWCIIHSDGSLGSIHVEKNYRNKGYATQITFYMIKKVRELNKIPFVFIGYENYKSLSLVKKIGFQQHEIVNWLTVEK